MNLFLPWKIQIKAQIQFLLVEKLDPGRKCKKLLVYWIIYLPVPYTSVIIQDTGLWGIYFVTDAYNQENMIFNIAEEWMRLCTSVTDFEVTMGNTYWDPDSHVNPTFCFGR